MDVGERIKNRRKELGLSAESLAVEIGVSPATIYRYESAQISNMRTDKLSLLAEALDTTPEYLIGWTDDPRNFEDGALIASIPQAWLDAFDGDAEQAMHAWEAADDEARNEALNEAIPTYPGIIPIRKKRVPLLGTIAAGEPIFADESKGVYAACDRDIKCDFALEVKGNSMTGAHIYSGDIVFIRKQEDVNDGQIAAVIIDDEATLKHVYHLPGLGLQLMPDNPEHKPIVLIGEDCAQVRILGLAVAYQHALI